MNRARRHEAFGDGGPGKKKEETPGKSTSLLRLARQFSLLLAVLTFFILHPSAFLLSPGGDLL